MRVTEQSGRGVLTGIAVAGILLAAAVAPAQDAGEWRYIGGDAAQTGLQRSP